MVNTENNKEIITSVKYDNKTIGYFNLYRGHCGLKRIILIAGKILSLLFICGILRHFLIPSVYEIIVGLKNKSDILLDIFKLIFAIFMLIPLTLVIFYNPLKFYIKAFVPCYNYSFIFQYTSYKFYIKFEDNNIIIIPVLDPKNSFKYSWDEIKKILEVNNYYYLYFKKGYIIIEKDPNMMVSGEYNQLVDIISKKIKDKKYQKCEKQFENYVISSTEKGNYKVEKVKEAQINLEEL